MSEVNNLPPTHEALISPDDQDWLNWFKTNKTEEQLLKQLTDSGKCLSECLGPLYVVRFGHRIAANLAGKGGNAGGAPKDSLKYSQLRRFVDALKDLQAKPLAEQQSRLRMFQIHLVHGYSRKAELKPFYILIRGIIGNDTLIRHHDDMGFKQDFARLMELVDAITAYFNIMSKDDKNQND